MPYEGLSLEGKVALVTGSARGIGAALAVGLAEAGADVAVSDMPSRLDLAGEVKQQIEAGGRRSAVYALDVLDLTNIRETVNGWPGILAGWTSWSTTPAFAFASRPRRRLGCRGGHQLKGVFFCAQAAAKTMIPQGGGRIINIASQLAVVSRPDRAAYCASKAGVANLTRALAQEWTRHGITVNAIGPGPTETPGTLAVETVRGGRPTGTGGPHAPGPPDAPPSTLPGPPPAEDHDSTGRRPDHQYCVPAGGVFRPSRGLTARQSRGAYCYSASKAGLLPLCVCKPDPGAGPGVDQARYHRQRHRPRPNRNPRDTRGGDASPRSPNGN